MDSIRHGKKGGQQESIGLNFEEKKKKRFASVMVNSSFLSLKAA